MSASANQASVTLPVPHPGLAFCQIAERNVAELGKWIKGEEHKAVAADASLAIRTLLTAIEVQATTCAVCLEHKPTPLRRDDMGGYVCLTCVDKRLTDLGAAQEREPIAWLRDAQPEAEDEALVVCWKGDPGAFPVYPAAAEEPAACQDLRNKAEALERSLASDGQRISAYLRDDIEVAIECMRNAANGVQEPDASAAVQPDGKDEQPQFAKPIGDKDLEGEVLKVMFKSMPPEMVERLTFSHGPYEITKLRHGVLAFVGELLSAERDRHREVLESFAALARPRYPEEGGAPSIIDILTSEGMYDEMCLTTHAGGSSHIEILDAEDFRKAWRLLDGLPESPST